MIARVLPRLSGLRHLAVESGSRNEIGNGIAFEDDGAESYARRPPPLVSLTLAYTTHYPAVYSFIAAFRSTLQHLSIAVKCDVPSNVEPSASPSKLDLPHLKSLSLQDLPPAQEVGRTLAVLLAHFDLSTLTHLTLLDNNNTFETDSEHLVYIDKSIKLGALQSLIIDSPTPRLSLEEHFVIRDLHAKRGLPPPKCSLFDVRSFEDVQDGDTADVCADVEAVLAFGLRQLEWSRTRGDVQGGLALIEALRPLNEMRKDWRD